MFFVSDSIIEYILSRPEVLESRSAAAAAAVTSFNIPFTDALRPVLETLGLPAIQQIPLRWIRGDTPPHVDTGAQGQSFEKTYLAYLTDSEGEFVLGDQAYPIRKGTGFVFSEGVRHETRDTGTEPRLLLGPMNELGLPVGAASTLSGPGGTTFYIRQDGASYEYSDDQATWYGIPSFPCSVQNTDSTPTEVLKIIFASNITFNDVNHFFVCGSTHIQFGSESLLEHGWRPTITIDGVTNYPGLIQNGTSTPNSGYNNIYIYNLFITSTGSTLESYNGWIGQSYYGIGASANYIVNCSSAGDISDMGGGIVGQGAGSDGGVLFIRGCSSSGDIANYGGGIAAHYAGYRGSVTCESCWSEGYIAQGGGGIYSQYAGTTYGSAIAMNCYSSGVIGQEGGGIFAIKAGEGYGVASAEACYSTGVIGANGGGIYGTYAGEGMGTTTAVNCYSAGSITTTGTGIYGSNKVNGVSTHCYASDGAWSSATAATLLTGVPTPTVGTTWVATGTNQPYELRTMGYTPYSLRNIESATLVRSYSQTVEAGQSTIHAIQFDASGSSFVILYSDASDTISMNVQTGVISTTTNTAPGTHSIVLRSVGSYHITEFNLTVTSVVEMPCCLKPQCISRDADYAMRNDLLAGNTLIGNTSVRRGPISYSDIMNMKRAYAAKC